MRRLLADLVRPHTDRQPEKTAAVMGQAQLSYGELEERSNQVANLLIEMGCRPNDRICLFLNKRLEALIGMLGALKAGCIYVPVDVASPAQRIRMIVEAADANVSLLGAEAVTLADEVVAAHSHLRLISVEAGTLEGERFATSASFGDALTMSDCRPSLPREPTDVAHILFTSGSTGIPKGVMITHENVMAFVEWATSYFGTRSSDRISGHPPLHFDLSTFDIYGTFLAGAELHLIPPKASLLPHRLADVIRDSELTQWFAVPSTFAYMAKFGAVQDGDFPTLERVLWCGETMPTPVLIEWMTRLPHARFTNLYGPTEATIASSYYTVPEIPTAVTDPIPIGTACAGEELLVLDDDRRPCPVGEIGDLYIAGVGLSPGYWRDEVKTRGAFVESPLQPGKRIYRTGDLARVDEDGLVYFLGRADTQIKHRGYRIELGEIETAVNALDVVRECAVVAVETDSFEGTEICCAYAAQSDVDEMTLGKYLRARIPSYMIPTKWLSLEALPKNTNGKIDRRELKERFAATTSRELAARA